MIPTPQVVAIQSTRNLKASLELQVAIIVNSKYEAEVREAVITAQVDIFGWRD